MPTYLRLAPVLDTYISAPTYLRYFSLRLPTHPESQRTMNEKQPEARDGEHATV